MSKLNRYEKFVKLIKHQDKKQQQTIFSISAPSAAGKDGLWVFLNRMGIDKKYNIHKVVSTTTRYPRIYEVCGFDYWYVPKKLLTDENGEFLKNCVNPISFGKDLSGEDVWYCYTTEELIKPIKEGKSLFFNVIGSSVKYYQDFFKKRFPDVKFIATCWTISPEAQREKFLRREPNKTSKELDEILLSRAPERKMYDDLISQNVFDYVEDASVRLADWKHKQYKKREK